MEKKPTRRKVPAGPQPESPLLDYASAARYLNTTEYHVTQLWHERLIAAVRIGNKVRFLRSDLDAYIASRRVLAK